MKWSGVCLLCSQETLGRGSGMVFEALKIPTKKHSEQLGKKMKNPWNNICY
jgi:hypothetical protein